MRNKNHATCLQQAKNENKGGYQVLELSQPGSATALIGKRYAWRNAHALATIRSIVHSFVLLG
jgi:hypothetical protein